MSKFATASLFLCAALGIGLGVQFVRADDKPPEMPKPATEHAFFKNFIGEWDCDMESFMEGMKGKHKSVIHGKMLGDFWAVLSIKGEMMGKPFHGQGTFGWDSKKKKAIGTWVDSMGDFLWSYEGKIDGKKLIVNADGPAPTDPTKMIRYRDTWDFTDPDKMILTSEYPGPDGKMVKMMQATCVKKK